MKKVIVFIMTMLLVCCQLIGCRADNQGSTFKVPENDMCCYFDNSSGWNVIHDGNVIAEIRSGNDLETYTSLNGAVKIFFLSDDRGPGSLYVGRDGECWVVSEGCTSFDMSDNGKYIAFSDNMGTLFLYDTESRTADEIASHIYYSYYSSICLSPTGKKLLYYNADGCLTIYDSNSYEKSGGQEIEGQIQGYSLISVDENVEYIYAEKDGSIYWLDKNGREELVFDHLHVTSASYTYLVNRDHTQILGALYGTVYFIDCGVAQRCCSGCDIEVVDELTACRGNNVDVYDVEDLRHHLYSVENSSGGHFHFNYWGLEQDGAVWDGDIYTIRVGNNGHTLFILNEEEGILYRSDIKQADQRTEILADVEGFYLDSDDRVFFERGSDVFLLTENDSTHICSDVEPWNVEYTYDGGLAFLCHCNRKTDLGTLYVVENGEAIYISDNVYEYSISFQKGKCLYKKAVEYTVGGATFRSCWITDYSGSECVTDILFDSCID